MSEKLQELLLKFILHGEKEFVINCSELDKIRKIFLALGREVRVKERKNEKCVIMVYSRVS